MISDKSISLLDKSDVKLGKTYIDRSNNNQTKTFDKTDILSHTFLFQEAVEKMEGRYDVDVRLLLLPEAGLQEEGGTGTGEEHCICDQHWFGCVVIVSLKVRFHPYTLYYKLC